MSAMRRLALSLGVSCLWVESIVIGAPAPLVGAGRGGGRADEGGYRKGRRRASRRTARPPPLSSPTEGDATAPSMRKLSGFLERAAKKWNPVFREKAREIKEAGAAARLGQRIKAHARERARQPPPQRCEKRGRGRSARAVRAARSCAARATIRAAREPGRRPGRAAGE